jgi:hypothetical protein
MTSAWPAVARVAQRNLRDNVIVWSTCGLCRIGWALGQIPNIACWMFCDVVLLIVWRTHPYVPGKNVCDASYSPCSVTFRTVTPTHPSNTKPSIACSRSVLLADQTLARSTLVLHLGLLSLCLQLLLGFLVTVVVTFAPGAAHCGLQPIEKHAGLVNAKHGNLCTHSCPEYDILNPKGSSSSSVTYDAINPPKLVGNQRQ